MPITPTAFEFKATGSAPLLSDITMINGEIVSRLGGQISTYDDGMDAQIVKGTEAIIINCTNLPPSSSCLSISIIMHLEGVT